MANPSLALELFRKGYDTQRIADYFSIREEEALELVSEARSAALRLPSPYPIHPDAKPTGWPKGQIAYAGRN
ncbi:hypothetical protein [Shinella zoogloeoides]|uniref:hypothetical protein n=1 Tax=Shinella zoogloeoides TaxID=352475 RepID=UPI00299DA1F1|nr:hypothetical protein [Shinella zoogloeoides]WPE22465.1 hypothetical protein ShzoTeo12_36810 [Shinella zoogloeoides]